MSRRKLGGEIEVGGRRTLHVYVTVYVYVGGRRYRTRRWGVIPVAEVRWEVTVVNVGGGRMEVGYT